MGAGRIGEIADASDRRRPRAATRRSRRCATAPDPTSAPCAPRWRRSPTPASKRRARSSSATVAAPRPRVVRDAPAVRAHGRRHPRPRAGERAARPARGARRRGARAARDRDRARSTFTRARPRRSYEWLVFTSANGVDAFFDARPRARRARRPRARPACASPPSAPAPRTRSTARGLRADLRPRALRRRVAARRVPAAVGAGCRVLLARAEAARDVLPEGLAERGYAVDVLPVYRTVPADSRPRARSRGSSRAGRRGHVHVVVDGRQLLRRRSARVPDPSADGRLDRAGHLRHRARAWPARRRRSRPAHHRRPRRRPPLQFRRR